MLTSMIELQNLNALRAFEAAARTGSFVGAAQELGVTPAAIGQHVRNLELWLGFALFNRSNSGGPRIAPTPLAMVVLPELNAGFRQLASGLIRLREAGGRGVLTVTAGHSFVSKWLLPRLVHFQQENPKIEVRLDVTDQLREFADNSVDVGIRYGRGNWGDLSIHLLLTEEAFPVCCPTMVSGDDGLRQPAELRWRTLIHDTTVGTGGTRFPAWSDWFALAGLDFPKVSGGLRINSSAAVLQAAIAGRGVAIARSVLVADDLKSGALVRPFKDVSLRLENSWYIVHRPEVAPLGKIKAFKDWLIMQAAGKFSDTAAHPEKLD